MFDDFSEGRECVNQVGHVHPSVAAGRDGTLPVQRPCGLYHKMNGINRPSSSPSAGFGAFRAWCRGQRRGGGLRLCFSQFLASGSASVGSSWFRIWGFQVICQRRCRLKGWVGGKRVTSSTFSVSLNCEDGPACFSSTLNYAEVKRRLCLARIVFCAHWANPMRKADSSFLCCDFLSFQLIC